MVYLTVWDTKIEGGENLHESGLGDLPSSHCCGFLTTGNYRGWRLRLSAPGSFWIFLDYLWTISCLSHTWIGCRIPIWAIRRSKIALAPLIWCTPYHWMELHQTEPSCTTRAARMPSRKPLMTSLKTWRLDCTDHWQILVFVSTAGSRFLLTFKVTSRASRF